MTAAQRPFPHRFRRRLALVCTATTALATALFGVGAFLFIRADKADRFEAAALREARLAVMALDGAATSPAAAVDALSEVSTAGIVVVSGGTVDATPGLSQSAVPRSLRAQTSDADEELVAVRSGRHLVVLDRHADRIEWPETEGRDDGAGRALLHGHCHQKSLFGTDHEERVLRRLGLEVEVVDSGCCGLAGSFGYEDSHYDVSMAAGEDRLFPAVRAEPSDVHVVADGFSCSSQIDHGTDRVPKHVAELVADAFAHSDGRTTT